ncbi:hypothetical protein [Flavobacterium sp. ACAM 123]|jgi:hypothetical protein|uniref:hypothetical protein n=1 Tax=Flavobacterium sp. ACAM 123 TaxID=1189620 RepID=UPI0003720094|nr:hypothetical protein [Flavobacterium sp. ACAM 123]
MKKTFFLLAILLSLVANAQTNTETYEFRFSQMNLIDGKSLDSDILVKLPKHSEPNATVSINFNNGNSPKIFTCDHIDHFQDSVRYALIDRVDESKAILSLDLSGKPFMILTTSDGVNVMNLVFHD